MGRALEKINADSRTRRAWLETLLDAFAKDVEIGGIDFASGAADIIIKQAGDEEWSWIEARVRALAAGSRDWGREQFVGFLTEGLDERGRKSEGDSLIREIGTPEQQAQLLIEERRIEEAVRLMSGIVKGKPGLVTQFADMAAGGEGQSGGARISSWRMKTTEAGVAISGSPITTAVTVRRRKRWPRRRD